MKCQNGRSEILLLPTSTLWLSLGVDGLGVPAKEMSTLYFLVYIDIHNVYYTYKYTTQFCFGVAKSTKQILFLAESRFDGEK